jgi:hypothetical protein
LYRDRRQAGHRYQQDPPVFYLYFNTYDGISGHYLPGIGFLEKYQEIYLGRKKKSLVLSLRKIAGLGPAILLQFFMLFS